MNKYIVLMIGCFAAYPASAAFVAIDLSAFHNSRMQTYSGASSSFPEGNGTFGGIPFEIPVGGDNVWNARFAAGSNPRTLTIPVGLFGVDQVHTLINTHWGETGSGTFASIRFLGSGGLEYSMALDGNDDIRDYLLGSFSNSINGTTTTEVFSSGSGVYNQVRLDKQEFDLPAAFEAAILQSIELTDNGDTSFQRVFLAGVTVHTVPEPVCWAMVVGIGLIGFGVSRRACRR